MKTPTSRPNGPGSYRGYHERALPVPPLRIVVNIVRVISVGYLAGPTWFSTLSDDNLVHVVRYYDIDRPTNHTRGDTARHTRTSPKSSKVQSMPSADPLVSFLLTNLGSYDFE